eukprot:1710488-Alexandrium_andersonii.AAC.1
MAKRRGLRIPLPCPAGLGSVSIVLDVQPGVAALDRRRGPTCADCKRESPAGFNFRDPEH